MVQFFATYSEVFALVDGHAYLVASPDMTADAEDCGELPEEAVPVDHLLLPEEQKSYVDAVTRTFGVAI